MGSTPKPKGKRGQAGHKEKSPNIGKKTATTQNRLRENERIFLELYLSGKSVYEAETGAGYSHNYGFVVLKRPRVKAYIEKLGQKIEDKMIEKQADKIVDMLEVADSRLVEILHSPRDPMFGYKDILPAIKLCYQRRAAFPKEDPSGATANAAAFVQVSLVAEKAVREGIGTYEPRWIRERYGVNDPASEAIEQSFGGLRPKQVELSALSDGNGAGDAEEAVEASDDAAVGGPE